jgi:hypothetical protein
LLQCLVERLQFGLRASKILFGIEKITIGSSKIIRARKMRGNLADDKAGGSKPME